MIDEKGLIERLEMLKRFLFHDECGRQTISRWTQFMRHLQDMKKLKN